MTQLRLIAISTMQNSRFVWPVRMLTLGGGGGQGQAEVGVGVGSGLGLGLGLGLGPGLGLGLEVGMLTGWCRVTASLNSPSRNHVPVVGRSLSSAFSAVRPWLGVGVGG